MEQFLLGEQESVKTYTADQIEMLEKFYLSDYKLSVQAVQVLGAVFLQVLLSDGKENYVEKLDSLIFSFDDEKNLIVMNPPESIKIDSLDAEELADAQS